MRTLDRNKIDIWYVSPEKMIDVIDDDGNYTGETIREFSSPIKTRLHLYPTNGDIKERLFGKDASVDMVTATNDLVLDKNTLIFLSEPTDNYDITYDYKVDYILKSLNNFQYGLKGRI